MEAVPQMKKRSSLKMTSSFSQEQLEQLRSKYKRLSVNWDRSIDVKSLNLRHIKTVFEDDGGLSKQQNEDKLQMKMMFDNKRRNSVKNEFSLVREYLRSHDISEEEDDDDNDNDNARKIKENTLKNIEFGKQRDELFDNNNDSSFSNSDDDNDHDNVIKINK